MRGVEAHRCRAAWDKSTSSARESLDRSAICRHLLRGGKCHPIDNYLAQDRPFLAVTTRMMSQWMPMPKEGAESGPVCSLGRESVSDGSKCGPSARTPGCCLKSRSTTES